MGHSHASAAYRHRRALALTFALTGLVLAAQAAGAWFSGSLALLADAAHSLADVAALAAANVAVWWAARPAAANRTFGRWRVEPLAAAFSALLLLGVSGFVLFEAVQRLGSPVTPVAPVMVAVAVVSIGVNIAGALLLRRGAAESLTLRGAYLEVLGDLLGSVAVLVAGLAILWFSFPAADLVASVAIAVFIVPRAARLLVSSWAVFAEAAPSGLDVAAVRRHLQALDAVESVHDLHVWEITSGMPSVSAHLVVSADASHLQQQVLERSQACLVNCFGIEHCTFQVEPPGMVEARTCR